MRAADRVKRALVNAWATWTIFRDLIVKSFRAKLIVLVVLSVLVPSGVIWMFTVRDTERFQTQQTRDNFTAVLNSAKKEIDYWYKDSLGDLDKLLASNALLKPLGDFYRHAHPSSRARARDEIAKYCALIREKFPLYQHFVVLDEEGSHIFTDNELSRQTAVYLDSLRRVAAQQRYLTEAQLAGDNHELFQWVLIPLDVPGIGQGTACIRMSLASLTELVSPDEFGVVGDLYILDSDGKYLTQPRNAPFDATNNQIISMLGEKAMIMPDPKNLPDELIIDRYTREMLSSSGRVYKRSKFLGGKVYLHNYDWWIVCEAEESKVIAPVVTHKHRILLAHVLISALFVLAAWKMSQYLLRPLSDLSMGAKRINAGMVAVQIPPAGEDEIGHMISAFNDMAKRISVTEAELSAKNKLLQGKNDELVYANDKLEYLSVTDGLTGLYNHRHFWDLVDVELERAGDYPGQLGLVLVDVDNFKQVNDRFGHGCGDLLIQRIARILMETIRESDLIARYGGEEFAVLLPNTNRRGAEAVSEKVRDAVEKMVFNVPETGMMLSVTVSLGISVYCRSRREFFNAADRALYLSKSKGKNQVNFEMSEV